MRGLYLIPLITSSVLSTLSSDPQTLEDDFIKVMISTDSTDKDDFGNIISMQMKFTDSATNETMLSDNMIERGCLMNWQVEALVYNP